MRLVLTALAFACGTSGRAQTTFQGPGTNWILPQHWTAGLPNSATTTTINSGNVVLLANNGGNPYEAGWFYLNGGSLEVSLNGRLRTVQAMIAPSSGQTASALLSDSGAVWTITRDFGIGGAGTGTFTIQNGATLNLTATEGSAGVGDIYIGNDGGSGTLNIGSFAGGTTGGTINFTAGNQIYLGSSTGNGWINFNQTDTFTLNAQLYSLVAGKGVLTQRGTGTTILNGDNSTFTGSTTVASGTLRINGAIGASSFSVSNSAVLEFNTAGNVANTADTTFFSAGTVRKTGTGSLAWTTGAATFQMASGSLLDIQAGTFVGGANGNENWTNNRSDLNVAAGATFRVDGGNVRVDALTGAGTVTSNSGTADSLTLGVDGGSGTFTGTLSGAANGYFYKIVKEGAGTQVLSGSNTAKGGLFLKGGVVSVSADAALGAAYDPVASGLVGVTIGGITFDGGALATTASFSSARPVSIGAGGGRFDTASGTTLTWSAAISGAGSLAKSGAGSLVLTNSANSYSGGTTVTGGLVQISSASSLGSGGLTLNGGGIRYGAGFNNLGSLTLGAGGGVIDTNGFNATYASVMSGSGAFTKQGEGTLALSGAGALGSGALVVKAGTLDLGALSRSVGTVTVESGAVTNGTLTGTSYALASGTVSANLAGSGGLAKTTSGTVILTGNNSYTGGTSVTGGLLQIDANARLGSGALTLNGGGIRYGAAFDDLRAFSMGAGGAMFDTNGLNAGQAAAISGSGALTKLGAGTLTLNGNNTYTGATAVSAGTLALTGATASTSFSIAAGAALQLGDRSHAGNAVFSGGGTLRKTGPGTVMWSAPAATFALDSGGLIDVQAGVFSGGSGWGEVWTNNKSDLNVAAGATFTGNEADVRVDALTGGGSITAGYQEGATHYGSVTFGVDNGAGTFSGVLGDNPGYVGRFIKVGTGTQVLTGASTFTGGLTINAGTVQLGAGGSLVSNITNSGALVFAAGSNYGGIISGAGTVTKQGSGTLVLSGANTFTSGLTVTGGEVQVDADAKLGSGALTLNGGGFSYGGVFDLRDITLGASGGALNTNGYDVTYDGVISGSGKLTKLGAGTLSLARVYGHAGGTTIAAGTLALGAGAGLSHPGGNVDLEGGSLVVNGGTLDYYVLGVHRSGASVTVESGSILRGNFLGIGYQSPGFFGSSTGYFTMNGGTGQHSTDISIGHFSGNTGTLTMNGGTLEAAGELRVGYSGSGNFILNDGEMVSGFGYLGLNGFSSGVATMNGGSWTTANELHVGYGGSGTLNLNDGLLRSGSTWLGSVSTGFANGTLNLAGGVHETGQVGKGPGAGVLNFNGGTLRATGDEEDFISGFGPAGVTIGAGGAFLDSNGYNLVVSSILSGGGGLTKLGAGMLTLSGSNTFSGGLSINAGTLQVGNGGTTGSITGNVTNHASLVFNRSDHLVYAGSITGLGDFTKLGAGVLALTGANTFTGSLTISGGTLQIGDGGTTGSLAVSGITNNANLAFNRSDATTYGGVISGTGTVTKQGAGTLALTGANTYSGGTTVTGGLLQLDADARLGTGTLTLNGGGIRYGAAFADLRSFLLGSGGGTLDTAGHDIAYTAVIAGTGGFTKQGGGTLTLTAENTYTGSTTVAGGILAVSATTESSAFTVAAGATLELRPADGETGVSGSRINGGGTVRHMGAGNSTIEGLNLAAGGLLDIQAGSLRLNNHNALNGVLSTNRADIVVAAGASLRIASDGYFDALNGAGAIVPASGTVLRLGLADGSGVFTGTISGMVSFAKGGAGTQVLDGNYSFVDKYEPYNIGGVTEIILAAPAVAVDGGVLQIGNGGTTGSLAGNVRNNATLIFNRSDASSYTGVLSGSGQVVKRGAGTLTLGGSNTFGGGLVIEGGAVAVAAGDRLGAGTVQVNGGTLVPTASFTTAQATTLGASGGTFDTAADIMLTWNGDVAGAGALTKAGAGTLVLGGNSSYTGGTAINAGTLQLGQASGAGTTGLVTIAADSTFNTAGFGFNLARLAGAGTVTGSGVHAYGSSQDAIIGILLAGTGSLAKSGPGTLTLARDNTYSGGTTVTGGWLQVDADTRLGTGGLTLAGGGLRLNAAVGNLRGVSVGAGGGVLDTNGHNATAASVLGGAAFTKQGGGTLTVGDYSASTTTVSQGTLALPGSWYGDSFAVASGAVLALNTAFLTGPVSRSFSGNGTVRLDGEMVSTRNLAMALGSGAALEVAGGNFRGERLDWTANRSDLHVAAGADVMFQTSWVQFDALTGAGSVMAMPDMRAADNAQLVGRGGSIERGELTFGIDNGSGTFSGALSANQFNSLIKVGSGTQVFTGDVTQGNGNFIMWNYNSATTLMDPVYLSTPGSFSLSGGTVQIGNGGTTGSITSDGIVIAGGARLVFNRSGTLTNSSAISGAGSLTQNGPGTLILTGASTFTGNTTVSAGRLLMNGSLGDTNVGVASGATLGGSGSFGGLVSFAAGAHLAPGNSPGTITFTDGLTLGSGMILDFELGTFSDLIRVSGGTLTGPAGTGGITLNLANSGGFAPATYTLFDFSGATLSDFSTTDFTLGTRIAGYDYSFALVGATLRLVATASAIPEPSTYALLAGLLMLGVAGWRRRRAGGAT